MDEQGRTICREVIEMSRPCIQKTGPAVYQPREFTGVIETSKLQRATGINAVLLGKIIEDALHRAGTPPDDTFKTTIERDTVEVRTKRVNTGPSRQSWHRIVARIQSDNTGNRSVSFNVSTNSVILLPGGAEQLDDSPPPESAPSELFKQLEEALTQT